MVTQSIDVKEITVSLQQTILPLFWGTIGVILASAIVPIAAAGGTWVASKIIKPLESDKR